MQPYNQHITIEQLKRDLLQDALDFNLQEHYARNDQRRRDRHNEINQSKLINKRVETEFACELQNKRAQKHYIKNMLAYDYERQMQEKKQMQNEQRKRNRSYAQREEAYQDQYHDRRAREMARIIRGQRSFTNMNPEDSIIKESVKSKADHFSQKKFENHYMDEIEKIKQIERFRQEDLDKEREISRVKQSNYKIEKLQTEPVINLRINFDENSEASKKAVFMQKSKQSIIFDDKNAQSKLSGHSNQIPMDNHNQNHLLISTESNYKNYLQEEIEKRKQKKQQQIKQRIRIEKEISKINGRVLEKEKEELREIQRMHQAAFKKGLDDQITQKKVFRHLY